MTSTRLLAGLLAFLLIGACALQSHAEDASQAKDGPGAGATTVSAVSDVFYVPGKAIVCGVSGVLWVATMAITFGTLYQEAAEFVNGGCGGQWVLTGEDIKPTNSY